MNNSLSIMIAVLLLMAAPAAAYTIDGYVDDWEIYPQNDSSTNRLIDSSLIPSSPGISYVIENDNADWAHGVHGNNISNFTGPEWCDIEAMYVADDSEYIYVMIITSMPKLGWNWGSSEHIQPGDLALDFNDDGTFEYGVKIVQNDYDGVASGAGFGVVGAIYLNPDWVTRDTGTYRTDIASIVSGTKAGDAVIVYTGAGGATDGVPVGPQSTLPWDTFGYPMKYSYENPSIPNEVIEIAIPKSALNIPQNTVDIQSAITCGNGVIKLESVSLIPEFATIAIPVIALLGLVFFMRRKEQE